MNRPTPKTPISFVIEYFRRLLPSLAIPAYRWLWLNSIFGSMRLITGFVARGWLVLTLTDSPFWVGAAPAVRGITQIMVGSFAGVLLDRVNRRFALLFVEVANSLIAATLGMLVVTGRIALWHILLAAVFEGLFIAVRWPAIGTMIAGAVGKEHLLNASAAQMMAFNAGNVVASAVAGFIVARFGVEAAYFFATGCGLIAALCVWQIEGDFRPAAKAEPVIKAIREGFVYIKQHHALGWLILLGFLMSLLGWSNLTMFPVMARDVLGGDASSLGLLTGAGAAGSLISTMFVAGLGDYKNKTRLVIGAGSLTAIAIIMFSLSPWLSLSLVLAAVMQACLMAFEVSVTGSVLLLTSDEMQGRVQGIYNQVFGFTWVGGLLLGSIAQFFGAPLAIGLGGAAIGLVVLLVARPLSKVSLNVE